MDGQSSTGSAGQGGGYPMTQSEVDRAANRPPHGKNGLSEVISKPIETYPYTGNASDYPLQVALEQEWHRRVGAVLHGHTCSRCGLLRPCCADPCPFRATEREREWECGCQNGGTGQETPAPLRGEGEGRHDFFTCDYRLHAWRWRDWLPVRRIQKPYASLVH